MKSLSHAWLLATPQTAAYQAPPSMGFSRQEYWSGLPLPSPSALSTLSQNKLTLREACPLKYLSQRADASSLHPRVPEVYLSSLPLNSSSFGPWQFPAAPAQVSLSPGQWVLVSPLCPSALQSGSASTAQRILSEPFTDAQSSLLRALLWQLQLSLSLAPRGALPYTFKLCPILPLTSSRKLRQLHLTFFFAPLPDGQTGFLMPILSCRSEHMCPKTFLFLESWILFCLLPVGSPSINSPLAAPPVTFSLVSCSQIKASSKDL